MEKLPGRELWNIDYTLKCIFVPPFFKDPAMARVLLNIKTGAEKLYFAQYAVFSHPLHMGQYRIDIKTKTALMANVQWFGVHITKEEHELLIKQIRENKIYCNTMTYEHIQKFARRHIDLLKFTEEDAKEIIEEWEMRR